MDSRAGRPAGLAVALLELLAAAAGNQFGSSVPLSGSVLLVGALNGDPDVARAGVAYSCGDPGTLVTFGSGCAGTVGIPALAAAVSGEVASVGECYFDDAEGDFDRCQRPGPRCHGCCSRDKNPGLKHPSYAIRSRSVYSVLW